MWECFRDAAYFDLWCVRQVGSRTFGDGFHVMSQPEAEALCRALSGEEIETAVETPVSRFRKVGFSADAENYPLSDAGLLIVAEHNGIQVEKLMDEFRYAPNPHMQKWLDALGRARLEGHSVRDPDRRWWTRDRLQEIGFEF